MMFSVDRSLSIRRQDA